jgi:hypothetical protein
MCFTCASRYRHTLIRTTAVYTLALPSSYVSGSRNPYSKGRTTGKQKVALVVSSSHSLRSMYFFICFSYIQEINASNIYYPLPFQ